VVYGWDPDVPPPDGYALDSDFNGALLGNGIGLLAGAYVISALTAAIASETQHSDDWTPLFVPVVGPFITIGTLRPGAGGMGLLIADGVFQVAGVIGIAMSFVDVEYKVFRTANVDVTPIVGPGVAGFSAQGSF
jgi:hypothetical protein